MISEMGVASDDIQFHAIDRVGKFKSTVRTKSVATSTSSVDQVPRPLHAQKNFSLLVHDLK